MLQQPSNNCSTREIHVTSSRLLVSERFPRSSQYHPDWVLAAPSGGANALWVTERLPSALYLRSGMRVLRLGCGGASSSIVLRREFEAAALGANRHHRHRPCRHHARWLAGLAGLAQSVST